MVSERRRSLRCPVDCPAKLRDPSTGRYLSGWAINRSQSGILVELASPTRLRPGQPIRIAVAQPHQGLIAAADMIEATVVRIPSKSSASQGMRLALRYVTDQPLAA